MVHATDREAAVARLRRALDQTVVSGMPTTLGFHRWLVDHPSFVAGRYDTGLVADAWGDGPAISKRDRTLATAAVAGARRGIRERRPAEDAAQRGPLADGERPWSRLARWEALDRD